jgi:hypothetical protein
MSSRYFVSGILIGSCLAVINSSTIDKDGFFAPYPMGCSAHNSASVTPRRDDWVNSPGSQSVLQQVGGSNSCNTTPGMYSLANNRNSPDLSSLTLPPQHSQQPMQRENTTTPSSFSRDPYDIQRSIHSVVMQVIGQTKQFLNETELKNYFCIGDDNRGNMLRAMEFFNLATAESMNFSNWANSHGAELINELRQLNNSLTAVRQSLGGSFQTTYFHIIGERPPFQEFG